jgi:hypothetical protein
MAKPKLALIPAAQGSKFYSVLPSDGVGDFDFARASAATRINKYGLIETVASGQSRLNYPLIDGVVNGCPSHLLEPARTNLIPYSEDFSNVAWSKEDLTVLPNQAISPDGTLNADLLLPNTNNTDHSIYDQTNVSNEVFTVFLKAGGYNFAFLGQNNAADTNGAFFDLINGTVAKNSSSLSASIEYYGNGWFRCSLFGSFLTDFRIICPSENGQTFSFSGDGVKGVYSWGAQVEAGSYPTSYIVSNSGSATTRVAETANNSGDASTFNSLEGVLMAEISALANDLTYRQISLTEDGGGGDVLTIDLSSSSNGVRTFLYVNGSAISLSSTLSDETDFNKIAVKYGSTHELWINGFKVGSQLLSLLPITLNKLTFDNGVGGNDFYGNTKQIQYFDSALNDSELETLTSWTSFSEMATSQLYSIQ